MNWRDELVTLRDYILLPWLLVLLPWRWAWGMLWWLTRFTHAYDAHGQRSRAAASPILGSSADASFARRTQFVRMLDIIDAPLSFFRSDRHLQRWWTVDGTWPRDSACLAISLHYGNGLWALRHLQLHGHRTHLIAQRIDPAWFTWRPVTRAVMAFREWRVERLMQTPIIHSGGARARSLDALRNGRSIVAVLDNPQGLERGVVPVQMFGRRLALHTGILHLGLEAGVPVVPYLTSIEANGRRRLRIGPAIRETDVVAICARLEAWFQPLITADPAGWHLWPHIREFEETVARYHPAANKS